MKTNDKLKNFDIRTYRRLGGKGYKDAFVKAYNTKKRERRRMDPCDIEHMKDDLDAYFISDRFISETPETDYINITIGRLLLEQGTPYRAAKFIKNGRMHDQCNTTEQKLLAILGELQGREFALYGVPDNLKPFIDDAIARLSAQDEHFLALDFTGNCILAPRYIRAKAYVAQVLELAPDIKKESEGFVRAIVSVAVDARMDVPVWVKPSMSHEEIRTIARDAAAYTDLSKAELTDVEFEPVNVSFTDESKDFDF